LNISGFVGGELATSITSTPFPWRPAEHAASPDRTGAVIDDGTRLTFISEAAKPARRSLAGCSGHERYVVLNPCSVYFGMVADGEICHTLASA